MVNPLGNLKVNGQCFISNYKPGDTDVKDSKKINIWCTNENIETGGTITDRNLKDQALTKNYNQVLSYIAGLGRKGDKKTLEYDDIQALDSKRDELIGKYEIENIMIDTYGPKPTGSARVIFSDGRQLRIDFKLEHETNDPNNSYRKLVMKQNEIITANKEIETSYGKQFAKVENLRKDEDFNKYFDVEYEYKNNKFTGRIIVKVKKNSSAVNLRSTANLRKGAIKDATIKDKNDKSVSLNKRGDVWFTWCEGELDSKRLEKGDKVYLDINDFQ